MANKTLIIVQARHRFVEEYIKSKGWDVHSLNMEQVLEIRANKEWLYPLEEKKLYE